MPRDTFRRNSTGAWLTAGLPDVPRTAHSRAPVSSREVEKRRKDLSWWKNGERATGERKKKQGCVMQLARRKHSSGHNMKTLSDVSRKAHSNVLSLAGPSPGTEPWLSLLSAHCHVRTSGFQAATPHASLSFDSPSRKALSGWAELEGQGARSALRAGIPSGGCSGWCRTPLRW
ncbi:hypothetical protein K0M31_013931 [Melipona bicolor]|uniref:Uncharacterized protein n=1 Tax=Melipona bicolor TaxID=60889 RepID=A0AA40G7J2_9HYME|nr:hypothetical protein K0M31_013931 [Melipona bicolor]